MPLHPWLALIDAIQDPVNVSQVLSVLGRMHHQGLAQTALLSSSVQADFKDANPLVERPCCLCAWRVPESPSTASLRATRWTDLGRSIRLQQHNHTARHRPRGFHCSRDGLGACDMSGSLEPPVTSFGCAQADSTAATDDVIMLESTLAQLMPTNIDEVRHTSSVEWYLVPVTHYSLRPSSSKTSLLRPL